MHTAVGLLHTPAASAAQTEMCAVTDSSPVTCRPRGESSSQGFISLSGHLNGGQRPAGFCTAKRNPITASSCLPHTLHECLDCSDCLHLYANPVDKSWRLTVQVKCHRGKGLLPQATNICWLASVTNDLNYTSYCQLSLGLFRILQF